MKIHQLAASALLGAGIGFSGATMAQDDPAPFDDGFYVAPMASFLSPDDDRGLDDGYGARIAGGYRFLDSIALEAAISLIEADPENGGGQSAEFSGGDVSLLFFPSERWLPNAYGLFSVGYQEVSDQPANPTDVDGGTAAVGIGYLQKLNYGDYEFGLRAEGRARWMEISDSAQRSSGPDSYADVLFNVGLQLPLGKKPAPPPPPEPEVAVVEAPPACDDGIDNDANGVMDYPADPGCDSAQDDEELSRQCDDGLDNDDDGAVDLDDPGCDDAQDNDETDPCKEPEPGEPVSLAGCRLGDVMVLRGVLFEFDAAKLTANAELVLDGVVEALEEYPTVEVELSGHTDSLGSDTYNQQLSERRAKSARQYLIDQGIDRSRLTAVGYGEARPVATNDTDEGRQENRRVELTITGGVAE